MRAVIQVVDDDIDSRRLFPCCRYEWNELVFIPTRSVLGDKRWILWFPRSMIDKTHRLVVHMRELFDFRIEKDGVIGN
ncbi:hypothetical protein SNK03_013161 [Fusarium graminearum]